MIRGEAVPEGFLGGGVSQDAENPLGVVEGGQYVQGAVMCGARVCGGLLATASSANASILASSRINFAMGRDYIVTPALNEIHGRFGTPYRAIGITGGLILLFIVAAVGTIH